MLMANFKSAARIGELENELRGAKALATLTQLQLDRALNAGESFAALSQTGEGR